MNMKFGNLVAERRHNRRDKRESYIVVAYAISEVVSSGLELSKRSSTEVS